MCVLDRIYKSALRLPLPYCANAIVLVFNKLHVIDQSECWTTEGNTEDET